MHLQAKASRPEGPAAPWSLRAMRLKQTAYIPYKRKVTHHHYPQ